LSEPGEDRRIPVIMLRMRLAQKPPPSTMIAMHASRLLRSSYNPANSC
jgi:hypothetical protein